MKGVFFFGTPFSGSNLATYASLIVKAMNGNSALISSLRDHAEGLSTILGKFNQLRNQPATKIPILIAYEKKPMYGYKFVRAIRRRDLMHPCEAFDLAYRSANVCPLGHPA